MYWAGHVEGAVLIQKDGRGIRPPGFPLQFYGPEEKRMKKVGSSDLLQNESFSLVVDEKITSLLEDSTNDGSIDVFLLKILLFCIDGHIVIG